jgi:hypothetical protein
MPLENNGFEMESLTDVVMQVNFTAREGGEGLRGAARENVRGRLPGGGWRWFDLGRDFGDQWALLQQHGHGHEGHEKKHVPSDFQLSFQKNMFPFISGRKKIEVGRLQVFVQVSKPQKAGAHITVFYYPPGHEDGDDGRKEDDYHYSTARGRVHEVKCLVHGGLWGGLEDSSSLELYHGAVDVEIKVHEKENRGEDNHKDKDCGKLRFPEEVLCDVREIYLLCQYEVRDG